MRSIVAILFLSVSVLAQDSRTTTTCVTTTFTGSVKRGLPFVQTIGNGLTYQLVPIEPEVSDPTHPPRFIGWTVRIAYLKNRGDMEREFSEDMTPPYHAETARDLNTTYGQTIADVLRGDRTVYFTTTQLDAATAQGIVVRVLKSSDEAEGKKLARQLLPIPIGSAKMKITGHQLEGDTSAPTAILGLQFAVDLTVPSTIKLPLDLASRAHPATCPEAPLATILLHK